ncbi:MAG: GNAT family N-acetyltransferase [Candidatus Azotimanducaceae bacterium WSBS_2022_MAG_OTU7]
MPKIKVRKIEVCKKEDRKKEDRKIEDRKIEIRKESQADQHSIRTLTEAAFEGRPYAGGDEQDVIDRLRRSNTLTLSLVATDEGVVLGQITFSPAVAADASFPWFALGPVSVFPARQGEGIGSALIKEGLDRITKMGALGCILTGDPNYYSKFGFDLSPANSPENEPEEYFQLKLLGGDLPTGRFAFNKAFYEEV